MIQDVQTIFSLTHQNKGVVKWNPAHVDPRVMPCVCTKFRSLGPSVFQSTIFDIFSLTHQEEEVWPCGTQPMLLSDLCVHTKF